MNHTSRSNQILNRNGALCYAIGMCLALLAWCPSSRAQANGPAPASAEEVKQLREVVQSLLTRVTELESELKQRQASSTARTERNPTDFITAFARTPATVTATPATSPAASAPLEATKEQIIAGDRGILDYLRSNTEFRPG